MFPSYDRSAPTSTTGCSCYSPPPDEPPSQSPIKIHAENDTLLGPFISPMVYFLRDKPDTKRPTRPPPRSTTRPGHASEAAGRCHTLCASADGCLHLRFRRPNQLLPLDDAGSSRRSFPRF